MAAVTASVWCRSASQIGWADRVVAGLLRHGVEIVGPRMPADFAITWGVRNVAAFRACPHVLVMERAYLGDRFAWLSLGWDGLNGRGNFCNAGVPDDRWRRYWRDQTVPEAPGRGALIIGQVHGDMATVGVDVRQWAQQVAEELDACGVPWRYRAHPEALKRWQPQPFDSDPRPLDQALAECDSVITYNSNVGVLAAMAGKRVTVEDIGAMAYEVAGKGWQNDRSLGDRDEWGRKLSYCQWTPEETEAGEFWPTLGSIFS